MNTIELFHIIQEQKQIDREVSMVLEGYERTFEQVEEGNESYMTPVLRFVNDLTKDFALKLENIMESNFKESGRRSTMLMATDYLAPVQMAYLTARTVIDGVYRDVPRNSLGKRLSNIIVRNVIHGISSHKKITQEKKETLLTKTDKYIPIGLNLLTLFIDSYPEYFIVKQVHNEKSKNSKRRATYVVAPTEEWSAKMEKNMELYAFTNHSNKPMIQPPRNWNYNGLGGGYYSPELRIPIHKIHANKGKDDKHYSIASREVIDAVNTIQATPWKVNVDILDVLVKLSLDPQESLKDVFPPQPEILDKLKIKWMDKEDFKSLPNDEKRKLRNHADKIKHTSNRISAKKSVDISTISALRQAKEYMNDREIYFPYSIDYRGRIYSQAMSGLNPQGSDLAKGLLKLANGRKITTENGKKWYTVNLANLIGYDKLTIPAKVEKVNSMIDQLRLVASNPIEYSFWHDWDKPIQGLGACIEFIKWIDDPSIKVHTHVQLDGTCNGIQHLTALSRDEKIAPHVGLVPTEKKGDIYTYVCNGVSDEVERILRAGEAHDYYLYAKEWKSSGLINRKLTKKPVMTRSYAATLYGIKEGVKETILDGKKEEHFTDLVPSANYMGQSIWETMDKELYGAMAVMEWFKGVAKSIAKVGKPLTWSTPSGMQCYYAPRKMKSKAYNIVHNRKQTNYRVLQPTSDIDGKKLTSSIAPNIIHSFDASHLVLTTNACYDHGIKDFAFVHDSFGTHPDDAQLLLDLTKETFIQTYSTDYLTALENEFKVNYPTAEIPTVSSYVNYGDYSVEQLRESDYFFG